MNPAADGGTTPFVQEGTHQWVAHGVAANSVHGGVHQHVHIVSAPDDLGAHRIGRTEVSPQASLAKLTASLIQLARVFERAAVALDVQVAEKEESINGVQHTQ